MSTKSPSPWLMLSALCLYTFCITLTNGSIPPIISILVKELGISYADAGLLTTMFCVPGIFLIIPLSFLSTRFKLKHMAMVSMASVLAGSLLIALTDSYALMLAGRFLGGIGWSLTPVAGLQGVSRWFAGKRLGLAMGIFNLFVFIAMITAFNSFGAIAVAWGWKTVIWITVAAAIITLAVFWLVFKEPGSKTEKAPLKAGDLFRLGAPVWLIGLSWGLFSFGIGAMFTFMPDLLFEKGFDLGTAGSMSSVIIICTAIISPFAGYVLDRVKHPQIFVVAGAIVSSIFVYLLPSNIGLIVPILALIGITTAPFVTVFMTVTPSLVREQYVGLAFGLITMINTVGSFIGPYVFGTIRDFTQSYESGYRVIAVLFLLIAVATGITVVRDLKKAREARGLI